MSCCAHADLLRGLGLLVRLWRWLLQCFWPSCRRPQGLHKASEKNTKGDITSALLELGESEHSLVDLDIELGSGGSFTPDRGGEEAALAKRQRAAHGRRAALAESSKCDARGANIQTDTKQGRDVFQEICAEPGPASCKSPACWVGQGAHASNLTAAKELTPMLTPANEMPAKVELTSEGADVDASPQTQANEVTFQPPRTLKEHIEQEVAKRYSKGKLSVDWCENGKVVSSDGSPSPAHALSCLSTRELVMKRAMDEGTRLANSATGGA